MEPVTEASKQPNVDVPADSTPTENESKDTPKQEDTPVKDQAQGTAGTTTASNDPSSSTGETKQQEAPARKEKIVVYYTDPDLMELKKASAEITYTEEKDKYAKAFKALQESSNEQLIPLWSDKITLNGVQFENGALTLDVNKPAEANLGSGGEMFALEALHKTFFQFDEVESLELLVDGKQVETLMGHVELEHPMTRNAQ
ncbi:GerMN domain-containing protein [Paenibacillus lemnae]|uniref:GerMN domain-containing protein n=2 Tax=Paenibacillus lemnae TaxID=1330551 RepID=A0A848MD24_PAELE|nr:GerMN domain-containing protein [Paenibacillus lemnae]